MKTIFNSLLDLTKDKSWGNTGCDHLLFVEEQHGRAIGQVSSQERSDGGGHEHQHGHDNSWAGIPLEQEHEDGGDHG